MGIVRKGVVLVCLVLPSSGFAETSDLQAGQVRATYNAGVANLNLGTFDMTATLGRKDYVLTASGEVSIRAGLLYRAAGKTESNGARAGSGPEPQRYQFSFTDAKKTQTVQIGFDRGAVQSVKRTPKKNADRKAVPIPEGELRDVLDPLTAAFMSAQSNAPAGDLAGDRRAAGLRRQAAFRFDPISEAYRVLEPAPRTVCPIQPPCAGWPTSRFAVTAGRPTPSSFFRNRTESKPGWCRSRERASTSHTRSSYRRPGAMAR